MKEGVNPVKEQNSKKGFRKNEHTCSVKRVFRFLIPLPVCTLSWQAQLGP